MMRAVSFQTALALSLLSVCIFSAETDTHASPSGNGGYKFVRLLDNTGDLARLESPVISNTGLVAFGGLVRGGGRGVFALQDDVLTLIGDSTNFPDFNPPSVSGNGTVAVCVREADSGPGIRIVAWQSGELSEVVTRADGPFSDLSTLAAVNNRDYIVFWARLAAGDDVIAARKIDGGPFDVLSTGVNGPDQAPAINASNTVAFIGSPAPDGGNALFAVGRKKLEILASDAGSFHVFSGAVSLNDSGEVAFQAVLKSGVSGLFIASKKGVKPFITSSDELLDPQRPVINNRGEVAFTARLANGASGIFIGPNPALDKVIAVGDAIEGVTVDAIDVFRGLNDRGQIVFIAIMHDGTQGLYRADPVR